MLAARRLASRRLPQLPPCTCRFASTAAATASTSAFPLTHYPSSPRASLKDVPLFSYTPTPVIPPPLPSDIELDLDSWNTRPASLISANSPHEQLAVLSACLAQGDIARAEEVLLRIMSNWTKKHGVGVATSRQSSLASILPPKVHAEFLRAYFAKAIVAEGSLHRTPEAAERQRDDFAEKAWSYLNNLVTSSHWRVVEERKKRNLAIDTSVLAVALKGLAALQSSTDVERSVTALMRRMQELDIGLYDILSEQIFDVEIPSYLGPIKREDALELLVENIEKTEDRALWNEWKDVFEETKLKIQADRDGNEEAKRKMQYTELEPTKREEDITASLKTLRTNLMTLDMPDSSGALTPTARQVLLEDSSYDAARQLYIHEMEELAKVGKSKERGMQSSWLQKKMFDWLTALTTRLEAESQLVGRRGPWGTDAEIEPFMRLLEPNKMALITIVELLRLCGGGGVSDGMKAARAVLHVGKAIENEYHAKQLRDGISEKEFWRQMEQLSQATNSVSGEAGNHSKERDLQRLWRAEYLARKETEEPWQPAWTQVQRAKVGSLLVTALMETATLQATKYINGEAFVDPDPQPAFAHSYQFLRGNKIGVIKVNQAVAEKMDQDPLQVVLHPRYLPMLVKPKPWISYRDGCYLRHETTVMRTKDSVEQQSHLRAANKNLETIFSGLDVLGSVPWKINRNVFDVVSTVWNTGDALADIPAKDQLARPLGVEKPEGLESDMRAKDSYRHRVRKALQERRSLHSNRCDVNYKLEIARAFLEETFYFPHNLDFRGRAYPIPPNLSHIGNDLCRGILTFGEAKPLGDRGLRWLKIHLANVRGFDKASFDDREAYAMEHLDDIYDSADNPLEGRRWWLEADDPWQCLATCFELSAALRSPSPSEFLSSLPIHQDGTCNGLQHYAALGGDIKGASQVNLEGSDRPSDVYTGVANMAIEVINRDAAIGNKQALTLQGKITRKVVKQTVMTTVYGVTFIGAKKQIERQLKERGDIPAEELYGCALYLGRIVLDSIGDVFKGATAIQTWLHKSARLIAKSIPPNRIKAAQTADTKRGKKTRVDQSRIPKEMMTSVIWTTPLGLPVVQPYRKAKKRQVPTVLQSVSISDPDVASEVDPRAQATAFPPNFIHSLDATHMMMTALECKDKIAFASVHDSYWTHACSVDEMSVILRDAFIKLHSSDLLGKLREEFLRRYEGHVIPVAKLPPAPKGTKTTVVAAELDTNEDEAQANHDVDSEEVAEADTDLFPSSGSDLPLFGSSRRTSQDALADAEEIDDQDSPKSLDDWIFGSTNKGNATRVGTPFVRLEDYLPPLPPRGDFDLNRIKDSLYFFS